MVEKEEEKLQQGNIVVFENVTIEQGRVCIKDVNLSIEKGEFVYIIGKSGSGKSTLLKTIYAEIPIEEGFAEVCSTPLVGLKKRNIPLLRRKMGIVFQDFQLLKDRNIFDNIAFVLKSIGIKDKKEIEQKVVLALKNVGMIEKKDIMPYNLSEGEMQRIAIARAIVNDPILIICDEPTGNLDPITSEEIVKLLFQINKDLNTTILMATHDYIIIDKYRSKIICIEDEKIIIN
ncbi:MAG: ATP-binding cassette domain-containing protein [Bacteroidales bacterium]|jgi:cell division transport system ATP-binding protein|nr:ATP-binding cassette domain-containing protein [Bacteroidales bacterium]